MRLIADFDQLHRAVLCWPKLSSKEPDLETAAAASVDLDTATATATATATDLDTAAFASTIHATSTTLVTSVAPTPSSNLRTCSPPTLADRCHIA
jgi:hypothetical protein